MRLLQKHRNSSLPSGFCHGSDSLSTPTWRSGSASLLRSSLAVETIATRRSLGLQLDYADASFASNLAARSDIAKSDCSANCPIPARASQIGALWSPGHPRPVWSPRSTRPQTSPHAQLARVKRPTLPSRSLAAASMPALTETSPGSLPRTPLASPMLLKQRPWHLPAPLILPDEKGTDIEGRRAERYENIPIAAALDRACTCAQGELVLALYDSTSDESSTASSGEFLPRQVACMREGIAEQDKHAGAPARELGNPYKVGIASPIMNSLAGLTRRSRGQAKHVSFAKDCKVRKPGTIWEIINSTHDPADQACFRLGLTEGLKLEATDD